MSANNESPDLSRRAFLKLAAASAAVTTLTGVGAASYAFGIEPSNIEVARREMRLPRLAPEFDGYRLLQFGDIHMGTWMTRERLQHIVELVNAEAPDLIAVTGDFVTIDPVSRWAGDLVMPLRDLSAPDGVVAILGNHDHWTDPEAVHGIIRDSGLIDLNNRVRTLSREGTTMHVCGVDDYWERKADLPAVLDNLPPQGAAVLLAHEPDYADVSAASGRFDLQISGHSHGGQIVVPFIGPPVLPQYAHKYPMGTYRVGNMIQYTNRGVGMIAPYVRFNCRPEITVFTLRAVT